MRQWTELLERIIDYYPEVDPALFARLSLFFAEHPLPDSAPEVVRDPDHPFIIADLLASLKLDSASIAAAMLLDRVRMGGVELDLVRTVFGEDVAYLVDGVSRICTLSSRARTEGEAESFRKMAMAMARDLRVILIRLALKVRQMRFVTQRLDLTPPARQLAKDVLEIDAPIAHRLGMHRLKSELEDLGFQLRYPREYDDLRRQVLERRKGGADVVRRVVAILKNHLAHYGLEGQVSGREKHLYSIWNKLANRGMGLDDLYDLIAYRIIVPSQGDCYRVLGMVHGEFEPIPGRFKDYIALPKGNGYQSLHTAVFGPFGNRIEVQIRTERMHLVAESGVAAHWNYKAGNVHRVDTTGATGYAWLKQVLETHRSRENPERLLENVKFDLFPEEVYVFTPQGDIVTLPRGATPVDFAYAVHSEIGDRCQGARVNERMVPLRTQLNTGDRVDVITVKEPQPHPDWLRFVVTSKARYRITRWIKEQERTEKVNQGRELLEREAKKRGKGGSVSDKALRRALLAFGLERCEDLWLRVANGTIGLQQAINRMFPEGEGDEVETPPAAEELPRATRASVPEIPELLNLPRGMAVNLARCCNPVPGDPVVGIISTGRGIAIHVSSCPNLVSFADQPERWLNDLGWSRGGGQRFVARLRVRATETRNLLATVGHAVTGVKSRILEARQRSHERSSASELILDVEVETQSQLDEVLRAIRGASPFFNVDRIQG
ncbi:MAG: bifunctional (p)ppGpp synthetase/guanosine-3',5'-bis(diphosphate) 3'-pyrophosphohydrolase [Magnetococcus sp. WYHC-3]